MFPRKKRVSFFTPKILEVIVIKQVYSRENLKNAGRAFQTDVRVSFANTSTEFISIFPQLSAASRPTLITQLQYVEQSKPKAHHQISLL